MHPSRRRSTWSCPRDANPSTGDYRKGFMVCNQLGDSGTCIFTKCIPCWDFTTINRTGVSTSADHPLCSVYPPLASMTSYWRPHQNRSQTLQPLKLKTNLPLQTAVTQNGSLGARSADGESGGYSCWTKNSTLPKYLQSSTWTAAMP